MIRLGRQQYDQIAACGERAYPRECCGLLVGQREDGGRPHWLITRVAESENLAAAGREDRFEVDPRLQIKLQRQLRGSDLRIIGVYHSHPDGEARPSRHDLALANDPELVWIITAVRNGRAAETTAHVLAGDGSAFRQIAMEIGESTASS